MFTKNNNITIKQEIAGKINFNTNCIDFRFEKFETIYKKELSYSLKV